MGWGRGGGGGGGDSRKEPKNRRRNTWYNLLHTKNKNKNTQYLSWAVHVYYKGERD